MRRRGAGFAANLCARNDLQRCKIDSHSIATQIPECSQGHKASVSTTASFAGARLEGCGFKGVLDKPLLDEVSPMGGRREVIELL